MIEWELVKDWLIDVGYITPEWEKIQVSGLGVYCSDTVANTSISVFENGGFLTCVVGCLNPRVYAGGDTDRRCESHWDAIYYMDDELEHLFDRMEAKLP